MTGDPPAWPGLDRPSYTMVPDAILDDLMADLSGAEFKVLLYIVRRTIGWRREADAISLSQLTGGIARADGTRLDRGTGLSERACIAAVRVLVDRGVISAQRQRGDSHAYAATVYRLVWRETPSYISTGPLLTKSQDPSYILSEGGSAKKSEGVVQKSKIQQTAIQQTLNEDTPLVPPTAVVPPSGGLARAGTNGSSVEPVPPNPKRQRTAPPPPGQRRQRTPEECATWEPDSFAAAWEYWGKRGDVGDAGEAWDWLKPTRDDMALMKRAMAAQRIAYGWGEPDGQVQPYFATFVRKGHWRNVTPVPGRVVR